MTILTKNLLKLTACFFGLIGHSFGWDGERIFDGSITDSSCKIEVNSRNQTIILPTVSYQSLRQRGDTVGDTPFSIQLSECSNVGGAESDNNKSIIKLKGFSIVTGVLQTDPKTEHRAKNVNLQITKPDGTPVELFNNKPDSQKAKGTGVNGKPPRFDYIVKYYAEGPASPGNVKATLQFEIYYP